MQLNLIKKRCALCDPCSNTIQHWLVVTVSHDMEAIGKKR